MSNVVLIRSACRLFLIVCIISVCFIYFLLPRKMPKYSCIYSDTFTSHLYFVSGL